METELVRVATAHGVARLTLDSPRNRNALSVPLIKQLRAALKTAAKDDTVRVVVLDHAGPAFCSGADLTDPQASMKHLPDLLADVWELPKPVVAEVAGPARAGGIGLVAAADIALAADTATFAFTEVRLGVVPAVISATVLPRLRPRAASRLMLTGEQFDAAAAVAAGLVTEAVPAAGLPAAVSGVCADLLRGAPTALADTKLLLRMVSRPEDAIRQILYARTDRSVKSFRSPEAAEGIAAFRAKRDPSWVLDHPR